MTDSPSYEGPTFKEVELASWEKKADKYDALLGQVTNQAIELLLDAAGIGKTSKILDVASGPGYAAGGAAARGADALGLDISPNMVAEAERNFPDAEYCVGEGDALPFEDETFDAVVSSFGILHMPDPDKAITEACRVLRPQGRYAFTTWVAPDKHPFLTLINDAIKTHGDVNVPLPPAPDNHRFSDPDECRRTLEGTGFSDVVVTDLHLSWRTESAGAFLEMIHDSLVRASMMFVHQTPEARPRIEAAILDGAERFKTPDGYEIAWPAVLASARKT